MTLYVERRAAADRILKGWAELLVEALDEARRAPVGSDHPPITD
jgi:hypothetical protein